MNKACADRFESTMDIKKNLTYENVKARVLGIGRYSVFEATASDKRAGIFDSLLRDPELVCTPVGYPWVKVEKAR